MSLTRMKLESNRRISNDFSGRDLLSDKGLLLIEEFRSKDRL